MSSSFCDWIKPKTVIGAEMITPNTCIVYYCSIVIEFFLNTVPKLQTPSFPQLPLHEKLIKYQMIF